MIKDKRSATIEAAQYAAWAVSTSENILETMANFNIDVDVVRGIVDSALEDEEPLDIGTLLMGIITGCVLERRRDL